MSQGLMHLASPRIPVLASLCLLAASLSAETPPAASPDFIRFHEDDKGAQLQTAIGTYRNAAGVTVELIGAVHIADPHYYDVLNHRFTKLDALLYEMVGEPLEPVAGAESPDPPALEPPPAPKPAAANEDPLVTGLRLLADVLAESRKPERNVAPKAAPDGEAPAEQAARDRMNWLHPLYLTMKHTLKLESQMEGIDYTKKNFVHADMTAREFAAMQEDRGEGFLMLWLRTVQAQLEHPEITENTPGLMKILEILCRPDSPTELKRLLGRMFDQVEKLMAGMEAGNGSVIVTERNKVALKVLTEEIAKGRKRLGIFYGAAHLADMEQRLLAMGFQREKLEWVTAWDLPPEPPPAVEPGTPAGSGAQSPLPKQ